MDRATLVNKLFDIGTTRLLTSGGYETVGEIMQATDSTLLLVRGMNSAILRVIRERIAAKMGEAKSVDSQEETRSAVPVRDVLRWDPPRDQSGRIAMPNLEEALEMIANAGPDAINEIDRKIEALRSQVMKFRRMRKLLAGTSSDKVERTAKSTRAKGQRSPAQVGISHRAREIIKESGPMRVKDLAVAITEQGTEIHYLALAKILSQDPILRKNEDGLIELCD